MAKRKDVSAYDVGDSLFFKNRVIAYFHSKEMRVGSKVVDGVILNSMIQRLLDDGAVRARMNNRKTVRPHDIYVSEVPSKAPKYDKNALDKLVAELEEEPGEKRKIMYYDIVTHIMKHGHEEPKYDQIMLYCNYMIRQGHTYIE